MDLSTYPPDVQRFISELIKRNVITNHSLEDKTLINYLSTLPYDEDYIKSMLEDR